MITLQRLVELRADVQLQQKFRNVITHIVSMLSNLEEKQAQLENARNGGTLWIDQEFLEVSEGLMIALYEEGRLDGLHDRQAEKYEADR